MPYQTSRGSGYTDAANSIAKLFVGDPVADAAARNQQIKNETEYARQKYLQEQAISEATRRKQMEAAAAANAALASERQQGIDARAGLGELMTQDHRSFDTPGGMSVPGDAPAGTPGAGFSLDAQGPEMLGHIYTGGLDPSQLSAAAIMPGVSDNDIGRLMVGAGNFIGKDDYVSLDDRNRNRTFEVGANSRLLDGSGSEMAGVTPNQDAATAALANQRQATADYQARRPATGAGGKVPRLAEEDLTAIMTSALGARGADLGKLYPDEYLSGQPGLYDDMIQIISAAWQQSGGNSAAVLAALNNYLGDTSFEEFRSDGWGGPSYNPVQRPDVSAVLQQLLAPSAGSPAMGGGAGVDPAIFTEGGNEDLQPLQNVGNSGDGQWKILGVR